MFKLITKPIRWVLRIVLGLVITALIPVFLLYKSVTPPTLTEETFNIEEIITTELDYLIDDNNTDKKVDIFLSENLINNEIKNAVIKQIGNEFVSDDYIYDTQFIKLQGAWVIMNDDKIDIVVGVHFNAFIMTIKSRILISFDIDSTNPTELKLKLNKANLGNIPLKWAIKLLPSLAERITGSNLDDTINNLFKSIGSYDKDIQEVTIDFKKLAASANNDLLVNMVELIDEVNLIEIGIKEKNSKMGAIISLDLNEVESVKNIPVLDPNDKLNNEAEFNDFIEKKVLSSLIGTGNKISFSENELNIIIDYITKDMVTNNLLLEQEVYKGFSVLVLKPYFELDGTNGYINVPLRLAKGLDSFKSNILFEVTFGKDNNDLLVNILNIKFGELEISEGLKENLFEIIDGEGSLIVDNAIKVPDFFVPFNDANLEVSNPTIVNSKLEFEFDNIDVEGLLNDILNDFSNNDVKDVAGDILTAINNEEDYEDLIDDLQDTFEGLTEVEQEELFDIINDYFGGLLP